MVAPKGPWSFSTSYIPRRLWRSLLIRCRKDPSGDTEEVALAWASGIGGGRSGYLETNFKS